MTLLNITYLAGWSVVLTWSLPQRISRANAMTPQVLSAETTDMPIGSVPDWPAGVVEARGRVQPSAPSGGLPAIGR
jgi:hypothetical protein